MNKDPEPPILEFHKFYHFSIATGKTFGNSRKKIVIFFFSIFIGFFRLWESYNFNDFDEFNPYLQINYFDFLP